MANAIFMVVTPEPSALGMGTAAGTGPGEDGGVGRVAALCSLGDLISPSWFHSLLGLYHHSCHVVFLRSPVWNLAL